MKYKTVLLSAMPYVNLSIWASLLLIYSPSLSSLVDLFYAPFLGVIGAIIANATGVGGGIVFIPVFHNLGFDELTMVGTSTLIQCFGMTMGSYMYFIAHFKQKKPSDKKHVKTIYCWLLPATIIGVYMGRYGIVDPTHAVLLIFKYMSVLLGISLMAFFIFLERRNNYGYQHQASDKYMFIAIGVFGGIITAWTSIGVGELVAFFLLFKRLAIMSTLMIAVSTNALGVLIAAPFHILNNSYSIDLLLFASIGAMLGGAIARRLVTTIGPQPIKWLCASWMVLAGSF